MSRRKVISFQRWVLGIATAPICLPLAFVAVCGDVSTGIINAIYDWIGQVAPIRYEDEDQA